jgi:hypothetical protein
MPVPSSNVRRFWALVLTLFLGYSFIVTPAQLAWTEYWLLRDGQQGIGVVTKVGWTGHGGVAYQYRVNQVEYTGGDAVRAYNHGHGDMSPAAVIGQHLVVYFSASHPWLSRLNPPNRRISPYGLPFLAGMWALLAFLTLTVIKPDSRWSLAMGDHKFFLGPRSTLNRPGS